MNRITMVSISVFFALDECAARRKHQAFFEGRGFTSHGEYPPLFFYSKTMHRAALYNLSALAFF